MPDPYRFDDLLSMRSGRRTTFRLDVTSDILRGIAEGPPPPPQDLLVDLDRAGTLAGQAFDRYVARVHPGAGLYDLSESQLKSAIKLFEEALKEAGIAEEVRSTIHRLMPMGWGRFIPDARAGRMSYALFLIETIDKEEQEANTPPQPAREDRHPVIAYLDKLGKRAVADAVKAYKAKIPAQYLTNRPLAGLGSNIPPDVFQKASEAALKKLARTFTRVPAHDAWREVTAWAKRTLPAGVIWTVIGAAGAGALATLILAPRAVGEAAGTLKIKKLGFKKDFEIFRSRDGNVSVKLGGSLYLLPEGLKEGHLWEQTSAAFKVQLRAGVRYGPLSLTANVGHGPGGAQFGIMLSVKLAEF